MEKELSNTAKSFGLLFLVVVFGMGAGCSQDQGATPQKQPQAPLSQSSSQQPTVAAPPPAAPSAASAPSTLQPDPQNFAQVQVGMTSQQVQLILGNPGRTKQEKGQIEWEYYTQQGKFEVNFLNDRVVSTSRH